MKILSKRGAKDYYDFLVGVYGEDPKIILDRREFDKPLLIPPRIVRFHICGLVYEGWYNGNFYYGEDLLKVEDKKTYKNKWARFFNVYGFRPFDLAKIRYIYKDVYKTEKTAHIAIDPYPDKEELNKKFNCPILMSDIHSAGHLPVLYPILKDVDINKVIPAHDMYLMLCEWLAPKDEIQDNQTDKEKIISGGFDLKTSFRKM